MAQTWNTKAAYGWVAIALHWIAALGVIAMFVIGLRAGIAGDAGDRAARGALMGLHISLGATLFVFILARVVLFFTQVRPEKPKQPPLLNVLANLTQYALVLGILALIISGPLAVWTGGQEGRPINVWGLFSIPSLTGRNEGLHELAETIHLAARVTVFFALALHVFGALKHLMLDRDGVFMRIIKPGATLTKPS